MNKILFNEHLRRVLGGESKRRLGIQLFDPIHTGIQRGSRKGSMGSPSEKNLANE